MASPEEEAEVLCLSCQRMTCEVEVMVVTDDLRLAICETCVAVAQQVIADTRAEMKKQLLH